MVVVSFVFLSPAMFRQLDMFSGSEHLRIPWSHRNMEALDPRQSWYCLLASSHAPVIGIRPIFAVFSMSIGLILENQSKISSHLACSMLFQTLLTVASVRMVGISNFRNIFSISSARTPSSSCHSWVRNLSAFSTAISTRWLYVSQFFTRPDTSSGLRIAWADLDQLFPLYNRIAEARNCCILVQQDDLRF